MMKKRLTYRQQEIYAHLVDKSGLFRDGSRRCHEPVRAICVQFGISSPNGVQQHLNAIEKKGWIRRISRRCGIILVEDHAAPQPTDGAR